LGCASRLAASDFVLHAHADGILVCLHRRLGKAVQLTILVVLAVEEAFKHYHHRVSYFGYELASRWRELP
jgi:hypothetical protein